jgi:type I restriction enzyme S subunit
MNGMDKEVGAWPVTDLPASWQWTDFDTVFSNVTSSDLKLKQKAYLETGRFSVVDQGQVVVGGYTDCEELVHPSDPPLIIFGDHTRCVKYVDFRFVQGADGVKVLKPTHAYHPRFAYWTLRTIELPEKGYSRHFRFLRQSAFPLPPMPEQLRIVARIEAIQERTRRAREALAEVGPLLEQFRQSVLAAAFRGDLTADWRATHPDVEPASELLARIRAERRRRWEEAELAGYEAAGKKPPTNWQDRYRDPEPADESELPEIPTTWRWITWNEISEWITYGFTRPMPHVDDGIPIVTAKNIIPGGIDFRNVHHTTEAAFDDLSDKDRPVAGDILITKDGTIGRAAIVSDSRPFCINQSVAVVMLRFCPIDRRFLLRAVEAPFTQDAVNAAARGMAMKHLSITDFGRMAFPLPPAAEQAEVTAVMEAAAERVDTLAESVAEAMLACNELDQSILSKAFRGELVPQDPNDEPATVLLDRIRAERAKHIEAGKKPKPSRSSKMARSSRLPANVLRPLREVLAECGKPMSPEELLGAAGYDANSIEDFYLALRKAIRAGTVHERRPARGPVVLEQTRP